MNLRDYLRLLTGHWVLIAVCAFIGCGAAYAFDSAQTPKYASNAQLFVSTGGDDTSANGEAFSQQRMRSYAQVLQSPLVLDAVLDELGLPYSAQQLQDEMTVTVPLDTVLIDYSVKDPSPTRANEIANEIFEQFSQVVANLDSPSDSSNSPVEVTVTVPPSLSDEPVSPQTIRDLALGLLVGLGLGVTAVMLREALDDDRSSA